MIFHPPTALHGLRRLLGGLRLCHRRADVGPAGRHLGALVAPWTTAAWVFLTLGIALGSAWAYYELGWGGWWFWDPVENASFMPWLVGTALIHSLAVTEKRGGFKMWTVLLAILAFSAEPDGHLPRALRRAVVGARLRHRPGPRRLHPRLSVS